MESNENHMSRMPWLDVIKTVAILMMIHIHVTEVPFSYDWEDKAFCPFGFLWTYLDGWISVLSPAWFMFAMGVTMNFARQNEPGHWISRGWKLILLWVLLKASYAYPLGVVMAEPGGLTFGMFVFGLLLVSEVLFFAGAFFLYFGVLRRLRVPFVAIALISLGLFVAGQWIYYPPEDVIPRSIVGNFVPSFETAFPFSNWVLHPLLGLGFGWLLKKVANRTRFYLVSLIVSGVVVLAGVVYLWRQYIVTGELQALDLEAAYVVTPSVLIQSFVLFVFCGCVLHFVMQVFSTKWIDGFFRFISVRLTEIYCFQWILIPWITLFWPRPTEGSIVSEFVILGWTLVIFALSVALSSFLNRRTLSRFVPCHKV